MEINRQLRTLLADIVDEAISNIAQLGGRVSQDDRSEVLTVNEEFTVSLCIARCQATAAGSLRWKIRFDKGVGYRGEHEQSCRPATSSRSRATTPTTRSTRR